MTFFSIAVPEGGEKSLSVMYATGDTAVVPSTHPNFGKIEELLLSGKAEDEAVQELVNTLYAVGQKLSRLSDRVTVAPYGVFFDGDPLRGELANTILALFNEDDVTAMQPLVNFLEKAKTNPSVRSIDDLYRWITNGDFLLAPNGDFIGYKGVAVGPDGVSKSIHSGTATVDGKVYKGQIPYPDGAVVEMPRSEVDPSSKSYCSTGLHVGTHSYASGFSGIRTILVQVNPRDVVSVPEDCNNEKLRVCRYVILSHTDIRIESPVYTGDYATDEYDEEDDENWEDDVDWDGYGDEDEDEDYDEEDEDEDYDVDPEDNDSSVDEVVADTTIPSIDVLSLYADGKIRVTNVTNAVNTSAVRDDKGRFQKGTSVAGLPRNEAGRFVGKKKGN